MKIKSLYAIALLTCIIFFGACSEDEDETQTPANTGTNGAISSTYTTPTSAFDEFNTNAVTISFNGDNVTLVSNALPNHTSPYWSNSDSLYIAPVVANQSRMSPGTIRSGNYSLTVSKTPKKAENPSATGLGAIGIAVSGVPIFNDQEGPNIQLSANVASGFDYAGGHNGPTGYHYHLESADVPENTTLSHNDDKLIGIMSDGFLLYGRKCNSTSNYPTDIDVSGGHESITQHSNGESFYHYHIKNEIYTGTYIILFGEDLQGTPSRIM